MIPLNKTISESKYRINNVHKSFNTGNKNFSVGCYYYRYYDVYMYNEYIKYEIILHLLSLVKVSLRRKSVSVNLTITRSFSTS